ncbi:hypothetical protein [Gillisia sp. JM1]|uniref:hypothetical protein n=1 Tax=Gillisia sp. JM1 TaxID=1283286 RepID=UPI000420EE77|nr:hypothetical protein [Gillisia sp. JM1]
MMRKALIYIALEIRAVFLFGIKLFNSIGCRNFKMSKYLLRSFVIALIVLSSINLESNAQQKGPNCESGERFCRGDCRPARECRQGVPPPPGLPIDSKLPYLLIAGLGLGIYYLRSKKVS